MADEITRLSEVLARDPSSGVFRQLAELLRVRGDLDAAQRVAVRGLERHTLDAEAHALLARICVDRGELQRAFDEWDMALRLAPKHAGALKGLAFITYRWGRLEEAERYLNDAVVLSPEDASLGVALASVRHARASLAGHGSRETLPRPATTLPGPATTSVLNGAQGGAGITMPSAQSASPGPALQVNTLPPPPPVPPVTHAAAPPLRAGARSVTESSPRKLFSAVTAGSEVQALLVDADGLVVAGQFLSAKGSDRAQEIGAELSGVSDEANRAMRHLGLGDWKSITFDSRNAAVAMARAGGDSLVVVASDGGAPLGQVRRALEQAQRAASAWLEGQGGSQ